MATGGEQAMPRRPDERDESAQSENEDHVRDVIRQGAADEAHGLQDTGRKPVLERAYEQQKGQGVAGPAAAPDASGAGERQTDAGRGPGDRRNASVGPVPPRR
jgi:hypothetical protein